MPLLVDVHCHLEDESFSGDIDEVIKRAKEAGINTIINNGTNKIRNRKTIELSEKYSMIRPALGLYPIDAIKMSDQEIDDEIRFIEKNAEEIIAIGEIGLDYHWDQENHDKQKEIFRKLLKLAKRLKKPIIVHSRKAEQDCVDMIEKSGLRKVIMHCFNGSKAMVKKISDNGWYFSIPANVVNAYQFQDIVKVVNINQLFTETDSPYLSPFRGKYDGRNEPSHIIEAIKKIAELKGMDSQEVEKNIYMNFQKVFK